MKKALIVIDAQKEYYAGGGYPLWNMDATIANIKKAMAAAREKNVPIVLVQHVFPKDSGMPIFLDGTPNDQIAEEILAEAPGARVVQKADADSFYNTNLENILTELGVEEIVRAVGYENQSNFYRVFKKMYGMTPHKFRKSDAADSAP